MSDDKMREALERLLGAVDGLIADMRMRSIMRGDYEIEDGKKIATLDCGNSVLFDIGGAREAARALLAATAPERTSVGWSACHEGHYTPSGRAAPEQRERVELTDTEIEEHWWGELDNRSLSSIRAIIAAHEANKAGGV